MPDHNFLRFDTSVHLTGRKVIKLLNLSCNIYRSRATNWVSLNIKNWILNIEHGNECPISNAQC